MNIPVEILQATRKRFAERNADRESNIENINAGDIQNANDPRRLELRRERLIEVGGVVPMAVGMNDGGAAAIITNDTAVRPVFDLALERIIGRSDYVGIAYLELGLRAAATVGRIQVGARNGGTHAFGTGFLVSPRLILTNNHVLATKGQAEVSNVEFNYQQGIDGRLALPVTFEIDPDTFFVTDRDLDYTLVAVKETSVDGTIPLRDYGWNPLIEQLGKIVVGEAVNIIQHPEAQPKKIALRENQITDILDDFLHYRTDTSPGSSGAPIFNDQWELTGIHHSGVPAMDDDNNILTRSGAVWTSEMGEDKIKWIGNEGIRISRIIQNVRSQGLSKEKMELFEEAFAEPPVGRPGPVENRNGFADRADTERRNPEAPRTDPASTTANVTIATDNGTTLTIPLQINIHIGQPLSDDTADGPDQFETTASYKDREGYRPTFLGSGKLRVPLPRLTPAIASKAATLAGSSSSKELKYINYSVVMNKERRMAFFTAVNIDGKKAVQLTRGEDAWKFDPRISEKHQIGEDVYKKNRLDRGHLVRRLDPVWGTQSIAEKADADTFHFTNCTPQHEDFNQKTWLNLEDYILRNADKNDFKASVFTGPVFRDDDKLYRSIRLPQQFWKVAVMVHNGNLSATGYMLSQNELLNRLEAAFVYGPFKTYQVPIHLIEELTGLDFGTLRNFDPLGENIDPNESLLESSVVGDVAIEIGSENDLRF